MELQHSLALGGAFVGALVDARSGRIPNWVSFPVLALGLGGAALLSRTEAARALLGALLTALPAAAVFFSTRGRGLGGGDVKLLAGLGACLGPEAGLEGELVALSVALLQCGFRFAGRGRLTLADLRSTPVRFGPALFLGTLYAVLTSAEGGLL